jgi:hypothetical protein
MSPERRRRRQRVLFTVTGAAALVLLVDALTLGWFAGQSRFAGVGWFVVMVVGLLLWSGIADALRRVWAERIEPAMRRGHGGLVAWTKSMWRGRPMSTVRRVELAPGERVALLIGLVLTALDLVLTALLLRDVFPEPPYRVDLLERIDPALSEWSFYVGVAAFKVALEVWFGVIDGLSASEGKSAWPIVRRFVLGAASAFDVALAASRGWMLAEQGLDGAAVQVSNLVFMGFGLAVPWVAAMTGGLLAKSADPWLARLAPAVVIGTLARLLLIVVVWAVVIAIGVPAAFATAALALLVTGWAMLERSTGLVLGHDDDDGQPAALVLAGPPLDDDTPHDDVVLRERDARLAFATSSADPRGFGGAR